MSSNVWFISDLHLNHKSILTFTGDYRGGSTVKEHNEWLVEQWNSVVGKRDIVWVLGDVSFDRQGLEYLKQMRGQKNLIIGNHDKQNIQVYLKYFNKVHGFLRYKMHWLSHAPVHPSELRGFPNIHGHTHQNIQAIQDDSRYIPVCVECCGGVPVNLNEIRDGEYNMDTVKRNLGL